MNDDSISRQAAIDEMEKAKERYFDRRVIIGKMQDIVNNLPSAQPELGEKLNEAHNEGYDVGYWAGRRDYEPRWIPVTERLPEPYSGEYLATINDGSVYTDVLWFDSPGDGRYESCFYKTDDDGYGVVCDDVIAWMPLPEPYKEGNDDRNG